MKKKATAMDLTVGSPLVDILLFSVPLVLGTLFQQLYSFVDTVMVGRLISTNALGAVGATYSLYFLIIGFVQGTCEGFCIPLSQSIGAKDSTAFQKYFWNGVWLVILMAVILTVATVLGASGLLRIMSTPEELFADALMYIRIIFWGIPAAVLYNFCSGAMRASGDSKRPFYFLLFTSFLNIALDYIFIVPFRMGVAGAAIATVISQLVSGMCNLLWIIFRTDLLKGQKENRAFNVSYLKRLCIVGFPMGVEFSLSAIGAVIMQGGINALGTTAVAAQTAGEKIRQMFTLVMESIGVGMATYVGQNIGARRLDRVHSGIRAGLLIVWVYSGLAWLVIYLMKRPLVTLVIGTADSNVGVFAVQYLTIITTLFGFHGSLMIMRNTLMGMGYSLQAVLSGVAELLGRTLGGVLAIATMRFLWVILANPFAWIFALLYCTVMVLHYLKKWDHIARGQKTANISGLDL